MSCHVLAQVFGYLGKYLGSYWLVLSFDAPVPHTVAEVDRISHGLFLIG